MAKIESVGTIGEFLNGPDHLNMLLAAAPGAAEEVTKGIGDKILDGYNNFADKVWEWEMEVLFTPLIETVKAMFVSMGQWFIVNLPDIMGYATIGAGIFIILGAMTSKGGMLKTLGWYFGCLILAICLLSG